MKEYLKSKIDMLTEEEAWELLLELLREHEPEHTLETL